MVIVSVGKFFLNKNSLLTLQKMSLLMLNATQNTSETCGRRRISCEVSMRRVKEKGNKKSHLVIINNNAV